MLSPGCSRLSSLAPPPPLPPPAPPQSLRAHTRRALAPQGPPPTLQCDSACTGQRLRTSAGLPCSASWARSGVCPCTCPRIARSGAGLRAVLAAAVPPGLPRFGGLSDEPPRPERFRLERHFPEGSGHARSLASIPFSRASPTLQALDSLCSFPVEESQGGLIRFGRCTTME
nr:proline-rich protein 18-like [Equus asinus]